MESGIGSGNEDCHKCSAELWISLVGWVLGERERERRWDMMLTVFLHTTDFGAYIILGPNITQSYTTNHGKDLWLSRALTSVETEALLFCQWDMMGLSKCCSNSCIFTQILLLVLANSWRETTSVVCAMVSFWSQKISCHVSEKKCCHEVVSYYQQNWTAVKDQGKLRQGVVLAIE